MIARRGVAVDDDATPDMQRYLDAHQMRFAGEHRVGFDRRVKIFAEEGVERCFDMLPQRIADLDLLARDRQLHGCKPLTSGGAARSATAPSLPSPGLRRAR